MNTDSGCKRSDKKGAGQGESVANDKYNIDESAMPCHEFYENGVIDFVNMETGVCFGLHHAQTIEPVFVDGGNGSCQFDSEPISIRERQMLTNGVMRFSVTLKFEDLFEIEESAVYEVRPRIVLIQDFVC